MDEFNELDTQDHVINGDTNKNIGSSPTVLQSGNLPAQLIAFFEDRHTRNRIKLNTQ